MFRIYSLILMLSILAMPTFAEPVSYFSSYHKEKDDAKIMLHFDTMFGVASPFLSTDPDVDPNAPLATDPTLRGIFGDYQSWMINKSVDGTLFSDGKLIIKIRGLIFGDGSPNDEDHFRALVSCQSAGDTTDNSEFLTFITDPFPVYHPISKGNADIKAKIPDFPPSCVAPVVMILNGDPEEGNVWFAVTGN